MTRDKFLAKSKTVQGIVVMLIPAVMTLLDLNWTDDDTAQLNDTINAALAAVGGAWALYGRKKARGGITLKPGGGDTLKVQSIALLAAVALAFLTACAQVPRPETARERLVVAEYAYQAALDEVEQAVTLGLIRGEEAEQTAARLETARVALESLRVATRTAGAGDDLDAQRATDAALAALLTYLETTGAIEPLPAPET